MAGANDLGAIAEGSTVRFCQRLAQSLWETDQYHQAMNEWRAVTAQEPGNVEAHLALARAYHKVGDRMAAFREYQQVLSLAPAHPEARQAMVRFGGIPGA